MNDGRADFVPVFLSEIPLLFRRNILNIDVALVHLSQPDEHGFCSLGPSVDIARSAIQNAKFIIGKENIDEIGPFILLKCTALDLMIIILSSVMQPVHAANIWRQLDSQIPCGHYG